MGRERYSEIKKREPMSRLRKEYMAKLVGRCLIFIAGIFLCIAWPSEFELLNGMNFFGGFSVLHILWGMWVIDMIFQLVPVKGHVPLGSQKLFRERFRPIREKINYPSLKRYIISTTKAAYKIFILWAALIAAIGALFYAGILNKLMVFMISVCFYVCDLICVLIWCPFRLFLKNQCCTTCRIFNWDHLMMFSPLIFMGGFYSLSLVLTALVVWAVWELCVFLFPERFWEFSNEGLKCANCTDKLCTQYCRKLRKQF